jgi:hypothetical protein
MLMESIRTLDLSKISAICITTLAEFANEYGESLPRQLKKVAPGKRITLVAIKPEDTHCQPDTVALGIRRGHIRGPIIIKDCDNQFEVNISPGNWIATYQLEQTGLIDPRNKSYITLGHDGSITGIAEKKILSTSFCCGAYSFAEANDYLEHYDGLAKENKDLYISHIIYKMLLDGIRFRNNPAKNYLDWGTIKDWDRYRSEFATLFVDIDGVLVENSSEYIGKSWGSTPGLKDNISYLNELRNTGKIEIILTTSRPSRARVITERHLKILGFSYDNILFGLKHARRILINDFTPTNAYPSATAINLPRNSNKLRDYLSSTIKE